VKTNQNKDDWGVAGDIEALSPKSMAEFPNINLDQSPNKKIIAIFVVALLFIVTGGVFARRKLKKP
jgi:hypothetical protein